MTIKNWSTDQTKTKTKTIWLFQFMTHGLHVQPWSWWMCFNVWFFLGEIFPSLGNPMFQQSNTSCIHKYYLLTQIRTNCCLFLGAQSHVNLHGFCNVYTGSCSASQTNLWYPLVIFRLTFFKIESLSWQLGYFLSSWICSSPQKVYKKSTKLNLWIFQSHL